MINILAIGNSFSQDALYYLHRLAAADGTELRAVNLFIGGCSLKRHWENIEKDSKKYLLEIDGESTGRMVSVSEALEAEKWDFIVTQQASHDSGLEETYEPYLKNMCGYLREHCPEAELLLHETWAYETDALHPEYRRYHHDQQEMYELLSAAYRKASSENGLRLIPGGDLIQALRETEPFLYGHGGMSICRDGFHMNLIYGRYLLACLWYRFLTGRPASGNPFIPTTDLAPHAVTDPAILKKIREKVDEMILISQ